MVSGIQAEPASVIQHGMWLADRLAADRPTFTVSTATHMCGSLDALALDRALSRLLRRHSILRSRFVEHDHELFVETVAEAQATLNAVDLSHLPRDTARIAARQRVAATAAQPFDMAAAPLIRAQALRVATDEHVVHLNVHHAVCDGHSVRQLLSELESFYAESLGLGRPCFAELTDPQTYAVHMRSARQPDPDRDLRFWRTQLANLQLPELPGSFAPGTRAQEDSGSQITLTVDADLLTAVDAVAARLRATRFVLFLSALQVVLAKLSGQAEVPVATTLSQRNGPESWDVIGPLFNTVVLRSRVTESVRFDELVGANTETVLDALDHGQTPFETVLRDVRRKQAVGSTNPLFNTLFEMDHDEAPALYLAGTNATPWHVPFTVPKSDLDLFLQPYDGGLIGTLTYVNSALSPLTAQSIPERLRTVLRAVSDTDSGAHHSRALRLEVLSCEERAQLDEVGDGGPAHVPDVCLQELFEEQARRTPDRIAVRHAGVGEPGVTYAELDQRADRVARALSARGVGAESRVAVHLHRSADLIVALLGVLKSGGAYVPLDPAFPEERLRHVVQDSDAMVVVTETQLAAASARLGVDVMIVDEEPPPKTSARPAAPAPGNLSYIIYTSGSTGRPKGVLVEHRSLVNFVVWCVRRYIGDRGGGAPLFSSVAFDMIVPNLFAPLLAGQHVTIVADQVLPAELGQVLAEAAPYAFIKLTPGHLDLLTRQLTSQQAGALTGLLVVGADAFPRSALAAWRQLDQDTPVLNEYGPTEATVANSVHEVTPGEEDGEGELPIGLPLPRTTLHVLDTALERVPPGVVGEIYIGGECVVRGYAGQPAETAWRFLPAPMGVPGSRMYRTGDLGRWNEKGEVEFLGRADSQVKIRGYRVEPAEVEAAVAEHPAVQRAVVVPVRAPSGQLALAAYAVPHAAVPGPDADLRLFLNSRVPPYLVPSVVNWLEALPLNENGKVDRAALPPPRWHGADRLSASPLGETASQIAATWAGLLGTPVGNIGENDDFYALGGDSLLLIAMIGRLRDEHGWDLPLGAAYRHPTVSALAAVLDTAAANPATAPKVLAATAAPRSLTAIHGADTDVTPLVMVHPLGGTVFCYRDVLAFLPEEQRVYGLTHAGIVGPGEPELGQEGLEMMCARYAREIIQEIKEEVVLVAWSAGAPVAMETAHQLKARGHGVKSVVLLDPCPVDDPEGWREQEHQLRKMRARLDGTSSRQREQQLAQLVQSELVAAMGVDPALCHVADRFFEHAIGVWQEQSGRLAEYTARPHHGDLLLVTSPDDVHAMRWEELATGRVVRVMVDGDHFAMLRPPWAGHVAEAIQMLLHPAEGWQT